MVRGSGSGLERGAWRVVSSCNSVDSNDGQVDTFPGVFRSLQTGMGLTGRIFTFWLFGLRVASI
jgi:hypothetical protein